jgi:KDO2-lipid IV(A) lauroyltransferase
MIVPKLLFVKTTEPAIIRRMFTNAMHFGVYILLRALIAIVQALPLSACEKGAEFLATVFTRVLNVRRRVVDDNLKQAFPELTAEERQIVAWHMWRHLLLMMAEIAHTPRKIHETNWKEHSNIVNQELFVRTLLAGRPLVLISAHYGNFELGGYLMGLFGFPTYTVARPLDNPYLDRFVNEFRGRTGQYMLQKKGSGDDIQHVLRNGGILTLLGDQHAGKKACWVNFFGRPASTHKAVALFSLGNNAPTMVSYARRIGRPLHYEVGPEAICDPSDPNFQLGTIPLLAQWYTDHLENLIRRSPEQYWWLHKRWKGDPPVRKRRATSEASEAA